ncbi:MULTISPECIES: DUF488 domain-containing protein [Amycolatopsis]|uniref:DUF488 domain-containing protein n=2 Tax=Amycolatopsis TaxID=1813 RepID=A0A1I3L001_9PSEU|nr:DUF488 domain-containing protein [Amycolatopsis sacchari]SFI78047.1 Protein of unknown function, DUF488 [Amycolatopsis sacchari]
MGVGYEGRDVGGFVADLRASGAELLVDVRLTPLSRKRGFSKRALAAALEEAGVRYLHRPALGNPKENRPGFAGKVDELAAARSTYADLIERNPASQAALSELVDLARESKVAVLCFEADEQRCHRHVVLNLVEQRLRETRDPHRGGE